MTAAVVIAVVVAASIVDGWCGLLAGERASATPLCDSYTGFVPYGEVRQSLGDYKGNEIADPTTSSMDRGAWVV
jgi:hypothetical protein